MTTRQRKARAARLMELLHECATWNEAARRLTKEEQAAADPRVRNAELSETQAEGHEA